MEDYNTALAVVVTLALFLLAVPVMIYRTYKGTDEFSNLSALNTYKIKYLYWFFAGMPLFIGFMHYELFRLFDFLHTLIRDSFFGAMLLVALIALLVFAYEKTVFRTIQSRFWAAYGMVPIVLAVLLLHFDTIIDYALVVALLAYSILLVHTKALALKHVKKAP